MKRRQALHAMIAGLIAAGIPRSWAESCADRRGGIRRTSRIVRTASGRVRGLQIGRVAAYRGIPYGASTAGARRFMPPAAPASWTGIKDCFDCGPPCVQINTDLPAWIDPRPASEDCLYLNVWTPATNSSTRLPVMVWIHGGAYLSGSGGLDIYDGAHLAVHGDVIVVTVNHRLSALGYLYLGGISEQYVDSGNAAQLDLVAALRWVKDNIADFGGDPDNVTVFGESGGGGKINALCSMPAAEGLFHKAIIESGSFWNDIPAGDATEIARRVLAELAVPTDRLDRLREIPPFRIVAAADRVWQRWGTNLAFRPVLDGRSILHQFWDRSPPPWIASIPMLIGSNHDESVYLVADPRTEPVSDEDLVVRLRGAQGMSKVTKDQIHALIDGYRRIDDYPSRLSLLIGIATDVFLWRDAVLQASRKAAQRQAPVYMYRFDWKTPCFGREWSLHGAEIPMVFGNLDYRLAWDESDTPFFRAKADPAGHRYRLAAATMTAWAEFARTGTPRARTLPEWTPYDDSSRATMTLNARCSMTRDPHAKQRRLLDQLFGTQSMQI